MSEEILRKLDSIELKLDALTGKNPKPCFEFIISEYNKTFDSLTENFKAIERVTSQYKYMTAGLLSIVAFILGNLKDNAAFIKLIGMEPLRFVMFILFPFLGIIVGVATIQSLIKYRERDAWCYGRMNSIRKIMLSENGAISAEFVEYTNSKYGSIKDFSFQEGKGLRHEWYYSAKIVEAISVVWIMLFLSYFFINIWLIIFAVILFLILNSITNSFYRKKFAKP